MAEIVPLSSLLPDSANANLGTERGREVLRKSLEEFGAGRSVLIDRNRKLIAGNKATEQAMAAGLAEAIIVETDGSRLVAVQRTDLDLDEPATRKLAFFDNRAGELDLEWNPAEIDAALAQEIDLSALWTGDELEALLRGLETPSGLVEGADPDVIPEAIETRCQPGELWQLGKHKIWVGDCTDAEGVGRLFDGKRLRLVWTDPPYGVSYADKNAFLNEADGGRRSEVEMGGDHASEAATERLAQEALQLAAEYGEPGAGCYVACPAGTLLPHFIAAVAGIGFQYRWQLVWIKDQFVLGRGDYHFRHENILYGWLPGAHYFTDDRTHDSVFEVPRPKASEQHPTMKPVALIETMVKNSSRPGDLVYDPFLGSGSTILACQSTGRVAYGCEIDARYADVCLARYEAATGETARRLT